jgi:hypothetical protein
MTKKLYVAFLPLLAMAAFTIMPAMAQAAPHWYSCESKTGGKFKNSTCTEAASSGTYEWVKTAESTPITVKVSGGLEVYSLGLIRFCSVKSREKIENPAGGGAGVSSITELEFSECKSSNESVCGEPLTFTVLHNEKNLSATNSLPATLTEKEGMVRDEIREIELQAFCHGAFSGLFKNGTLTPEIGHNFAEFKGESSGRLEGTGGGLLTFHGVLNLEGSAGHKGITAKSP